MWALEEEEEDEGSITISGVDVKIVKAIYVYNKF